MSFLKVFARRISTERSLNRVSLIGRAGNDAQLKGTAEHPVVMFQLATNANEKTDWHRISVFKPGLRQMVENYVKSGSRLFVEGKLTYGHIVDSQGNAVSITSIIADEVIFLSKTSTSMSSSTSSE